MQNEDLPILDFNPNSSKKKKMLFFKRPKGTPVPKGIKWKCLCGSENILLEHPEQFCGGCGNKLRLQENKEDTSLYYTLVIVSHIVSKK